MITWEEFSYEQSAPFDNHSIIFLGDSGQMPPIQYIPMYVGTSCDYALSHSFNTFIMLSTVFHQQGVSLSQVVFCQILTNLGNRIPTLEDWNLLMSRKSSSLTHDEHETFQDSMHLYAMNHYVSLHHKTMIKKINMPIALCSDENGRQQYSPTIEDE